MKKNNLLKKLTPLLALCLSCSLLVGCGSQKEAQLRGVWGQADATEVDVNTKVAGRLVELHVKEGSIVKKGQLLARIDAREQSAKTLQAKAQVEAAKAAAMQAQANLDNAAKDHNRYQELYSQGATSASNNDAYRTKYEVALAALNAANQNVKASEENLRQVDINLGETDIIAPFDGIVVNKYVDPGAMISTGMPIVAVQDPKDNWGDFKVKETELAKYKVGDSVNVYGRDPNLKLKGEIVDVSKKPNFASYRTTSDRGDGGDIIAFNVKVQLNSDQIRPGMRLRLDVGGAK